MSAPTPDTDMQYEARFLSYATLRDSYWNLTRDDGWSFCYEAAWLPDLVVAFPGGKGTADMVAKARKAGVEVLTVAAASTSDTLENSDAG